MATTAEVLLLVKARDDASKVLSGISKNANAMGNSLKSAGKIAAIGLAGGIGIAAVGIKAFVGEAEEARKIMSQTEAVLKSTGGVAGLTGREIAKMAQEFSNATNYTDDAVQSAQNVLLTFTKVGEDAFKPATQAILDMSTALGTDLQSSAILVGKALNDPIKGVTALTKSGVQFTQSQKDQIAALMANNDLLGAQTIILKELETQFAGSAEAAADPMTQLGNTIGELKEQMGTLLLPVVMAFARVLKDDIVPLIQTGTEAIGNFATVIRAGLAGDITAAADAFNLLPEPLQKLAIWLNEHRPQIETLIQNVKDLADAVRELAQDAFAGWVTIFEALAPKVVDLVDYLKENTGVLIGFAFAVGLVSLAFAPWWAALAAIAIIVGVSVTKWDEFVKANDEAREAGDRNRDSQITMQTILEGLWKTVQTSASGWAQLIPDAINLTIEALYQLGRAEVYIIDNVIVPSFNFLKGEWNKVVSLFWGTVESLQLIWIKLKEDMAPVGESIDRVRWLLGEMNAVVEKTADKLPTFDTMRDLAYRAKDAFYSLRDAAYAVRDAINSIPMPKLPKLPGLNIPGFAAGGTVPYTGLHLVGERGPELAMLPGGTRVFSNSDSRQMAAAAGPTVNNYYVDKMIITGSEAAGLAGLAVNI